MTRKTYFTFGLLITAVTLSLIGDAYSDGKLYVNNSAFNCASQLAVHYGIDVTPEKILQDLNLDNQLRGDVSLEDLCACLARWGLSTIVVYNGSPQMVVENVNAERSALVLFGDEDLPFYTCCTSPKAGVCRINKYPVISEVLSTAEASNQLLRMRSTVLLVQKDAFEAISDGYQLSPNTKLDSKFNAVSSQTIKQDKNKLVKPLVYQGKFVMIPNDFYLGKFPRNGVLVGELAIENVGNEPVDIIAVKGACSCFKKANYAIRIAPHQKNTIKITFEPPNNLEPRQFSTAVIIETTDPALKIAQVEVRADPDLENYMYTIPRRIDFGTIDSVNTTDESFELNVLQLGTQSNKARVIRVNYDETLISLVELPSTSKLRFGGNEVIGRYAIKIRPRQGRDGLLQTSIDFITNDENYKILPVVVRAWMADSR